MERSPYFIRNTVIINDYNNNYINSDEYNVINEMYNKTDNIWKSNYYIYLRASPEKCLMRILERGRLNEMNIRLSYLTDIHDLHEETYLKAVENSMNIIIINVDNKTISEIADEIITKIK
jgi:deoxyadenosine/deoxycytidine kinase